MVEEPKRIMDRMRMNNGIFRHMSYDFGENVTNSTLDALFFTKFALKNTGALIEVMDFDDDGYLTDNSLAAIADAILLLYKPKWDKQKAVFEVEYNPVLNYLDQWEDTSEKTDVLDGTVLRTNNTTDTTNSSGNDSNTRTDNLTDSRTDNLQNTSTRTDNLAQTSSGNNSNSSTNSIFGFNSATAVSNESDSGSDTTSETVNNTGTQSTNGSNTGTQTTGHTGTVQSAGNYSENNTLTRTGTVTDKTDDTRQIGQNRSGKHFGNIGNITSQKMLNEEIELWRWNFINEVLDDVKRETTVPVYLR